MLLGLWGRPFSSDVLGYATFRAFGWFALELSLLWQLR
ncbi:MAG: hypothetical protein JWQ95_6957 [Sphaerisporangium sp.]|jgi:hypothetical protein|nr:hypothetical protein [Sphaerisporangium sp.]